jgi:hypothetical protein
MAMQVSIPTFGIAFFLFVEVSRDARDKIRDLAEFTQKPVLAFVSRNLVADKVLRFPIAWRHLTIRPTCFFIHLLLILIS